MKIKENAAEPRQGGRRRTLVSGLAIVGLSLVGCTSAKSEVDKPQSEITSAKTATKPEPKEKQTMTSHDTAQFFKLDPLKFTKAPLRAEKVVTLNAPPEKVWALLSDHEKLPTYVPMISKVTVDNSHASTADGVGAVRTCSIGDMAIEEEIRLFEPNRVLAYGLRDGNPMGMSGHLGVMLLASNDTGGTTVRFQQYFNHPDVDMMATQVNGGLDQGINGLVKIFGGEAQGE
jgi:uncharacterized protein YndB with AHSA1/START domain